MQHARLLASVGVIGACLLTVAGAATAYASAAPAARTKPAGYKIVSKQFAAPAGVESGGMVRCPKGTVPLGGSAFADSSPQARVNVSASFPIGAVWGGAVKNSSTTESTFHVTAVCAKPPKGYRVVPSKVVANPSLRQTQASATCPTGTMPLGGGGFTSSAGTDVTMNGTAPSGRSWIVRENNAGPTDETTGAVAVCGKMPGYRVVRGKALHLGIGGAGGTFAACPAPTVPIGGGVDAPGSVGANFQGSFPSGNEWDAFVNNSTEFPISSTAVVVCAS
jgi:hypothetical protein